MVNLQSKERVQVKGSVGTLLNIYKDQGASALWRGNNPHMYRLMTLFALQLTVNDRIKNAYMPLGESRYSGLDYYWRYIAAGCFVWGFTAMLAYPLDLIQTRLSSDLLIKGKPRLYTTTFDCFNRTHLDEGFRGGVYKGIEISAT